tara:strand:+ start:1496 stop:2569 length:1074 start_codon:yes stop_codon:yes gene_type:complete
LEYSYGIQKKMFNKKNYKIPLDKFIDNALYNPKNGYYMQKIPFGKNGDFITAPNISKIFSEIFFLWLMSYWQKFYIDKKINIVELGAGNGEMMYQIISSAKRFKKFYNKCNFSIYEKSNKLIKLQKKKLKKNDVTWLKNLDKLKNKPTIFFGNEFLDALPVKQFIKYNNIWHERYVEKKGDMYIFAKIKCDIKKVEKKLNFKISKNQKFLEISFEEFNIIQKLNNIISKKGGCILFIDYAYTNKKMFDTLQAVKNHKKINILEEIGSSDISHMININFLKKYSKKINLEVDYNTQRDFLLNLGIMKRAEILAARTSFLEKANIFYRVNRLIDRKQMGELFKVIYLYKKNKKFKLGFK